MENEIQKLDEMTPAEIVKKGLKKGVSETTRKPWFKRLIAFLVIFCLGFGIGTYQCYKYMEQRREGIDPAGPAVVVPAPTDQPITLTISHIEEIISPASDLITTKYTYTDADTYENYKQFFDIKLPFTTNKIVFTYSGRIAIGIDLSKVSTYLDNESKTITLVVPEIDIKYNEIDAESFEYYNVSTSIFNELKMEDVTDLIATLCEEKRLKVLNDKAAMEEARANTEMVLKSLLNKSELTKDYKIIFK